MKNFLLTFLFSVLFLTVVPFPVEARIDVGLSQAGLIAESAQFSDALSKSTGERVKLRNFDDDAALANWLLRFQEIDAGVASQGFIKRQPAGTLRHLADLYQENSSSPLAVVVRSNLDNQKASAIQKALLELGTTTSGRKALNAAGIAGVTLPGKTLERKAVKAEPTPQKSAAKAPTPAHAVKVESAEKLLTTPVEISPKAKATDLAPGPETKKSVAAKPVKRIERKPTDAVKKTQPPVSETVVPKTAQEPAQPADKPATPVTKQAEKEPSLSPQPDLAKQPGQTKTIVKKTSSRKRLILFVALVILVAILLKLTLLVMRWQSKKKNTITSAPPPFIESEAKQNAAAVAAPGDTASASEPPTIETGYIGPGKVPALLKRCADLPEPVVLKVTKGSCEKLIYFAGGQVSGAMTQNAAAQDSGIRWNKLGSMLLREEFITSEERDQTLALLSRQPDLRFGEALLELGYITLTELRHALTRQAKITIFSLILFPEGKYKIFAEEGALPPEESVALEVTSLIREASHHQSEWMAIRQALPNLNTALDFTSEGREKLKQVHLSPQQEEMLSLVDGKQTINELGIESTMMDYEVYRFLYLMVKAGVLQ